MKTTHSEELQAIQGLDLVVAQKPDSRRPDARMDGLRYALEMVQGRRILNRHPAYLAAVDEMELFLMAAIERVENGEPMNSIAVVQYSD